MQQLAIIEFWLITILFLILCFIYGYAKREHKENVNLKVELEKAKARADYVNDLMELKDEANRKVKENNKKLNEGSVSERVNAAYDVLHNS